MSYKLLPFKQSPNYTSAAQTPAFYGRPRTIEFGAGHWWDDPNRFPSFSGVVNTLMNPSRQASAHAVVGDGQVQPLVRPQDTSWCTGNANPYTVSIETDPQIIYMWRAGGDKAKAKRIFETLAEYIADMGWHNLPWKPHKYWNSGTACNPIDWGAVMARAKQIRNGSTPAPTPKPPAKAQLEWSKLAKPVEYVINKNTNLWNFNSATWGGIKAVKAFKKGDRIDVYGKVVNKTLGSTYLLTEYSYTNKITNGFNQADMNLYVAPAPPEPVKPEWQKNLKDITPVKLMVLATQTPIVDLNTGKTVKQLGQGTWVDFTKVTTVKGVEYLISSWSATNAIPNGIKRADVGVPAEPPVNEKPEWLENWKDIEDVVMYTRADTDLVDLENGNTIKVIPRGEAIEVASTTEWHGHKYAITKYSTDKKLGQGIRIDDLDMKPVDPDGGDVEPAPTQPSIEDNVNWLVKAVKAILAFFGIKL